MNFFRPRLNLESDHSNSEPGESIRDFEKPPSESSWVRWRKSARNSALERRKAQEDRDLKRGYSISAKQVVLAFAVEFFIIGLILVGQYLIAEEAAREKTFSILLFPVALAVVELARVPLAIATRTQSSWSVKLFASLGVLAAVTVTSFSLSTIAYQTFDPRLIEANDKNNALHSLYSVRDILQGEIKLADREVEIQHRDRDRANDQIKDLQSQISKISTIRGENCTTITNADGTTSRSCAQTNIANAAQLKTLQSQLTNALKDRDLADQTAKAVELSRSKLDPRPVNESIGKAENDYRVSAASMAS